MAGSLSSVISALFFLVSWAGAGGVAEMGLMRRMGPMGLMEGRGSAGFAGASGVSISGKSARSSARC